jgi:hypothetical protein
LDVVGVQRGEALGQLSGGGGGQQGELGPAAADLKMLIFGLKSSSACFKEQRFITSGSN